MNECRKCKAAVHWAKTPDGDWLALDPEPHMLGTIELRDGVAVAVTADGRARRYSLHRQSCKQSNGVPNKPRRVSARRTA